MVIFLFQKSMPKCFYGLLAFVWNLEIWFAPSSCVKKEKEVMNRKKEGSPFMAACLKCRWSKEAPTYEWALDLVQLHNDLQPCKNGEVLKRAAVKS